MDFSSEGAWGNLTLCHKTGHFCLHFDFSERSTLLSKIEIRDAENSLQNAQVGKIYCPSG